MNDRDAKELIRQLQRINKNLEKLTETVERNNYIYKVMPTFKPEPIDPLNPYKITCETKTPYYGTKVDTDVYGVTGVDWTNKDSLEALK